MTKLFKKLLVLTFLLTIPTIWSFGQNTSAQPSPTPPVEDSDVVKISTALIQLDVVVTDKNGNLVSDLKPEDFEITENGERQPITGLTYFSGQKNVIAGGNLTANTTGAISAELRPHTPQPHFHP